VNAPDDPVRAGMDSALHLQRLFTCMAETKAAPALHKSPTGAH